MRYLVALKSFVVLALSITASATVVSRDLHIVNQNLSPDGYERSTVVADGTFPGPIISGQKGDNFKINVIDELTDASMHRATSIHWHGILQHGTNQMDGPSFVNQCPIVPDHSFLYDFHVPDQAGTYWYHSHLSSQYCDGLRGPLIVYDPEDPHADLYDVDDESTVITLADWYHSVSPSVFPGSNFAVPPPNATLINGHGRYLNGPPSDLAVIKVTAGQRYRFRLISTSCAPSYVFSIDGHNMTIIEADGEATVAHEVRSLEIFAAQRYSIVVTANQPIGNYWIRANPSSGDRGFANGLNSAILRYDGAPVVDPTTIENVGGALREADLSALVNPGAPGVPERGAADYTRNLQVARLPTGRWTINGASFVPPTVPVLLQILSGVTNPENLLPPGSIYSLPPNQVIELSIPGGGNHPFHLHGHVFDVVRSAGSSVYNYANPVRRDTVSIGGGTDNVTFRFKTDNPGPWFLHCHIDWHLEAGMAIVFGEDINNTASANPVNADWENLCPLYAANNPDAELPM